MKLKLIWMEKVKHKQPVCRTLALRLAAFHSTTPNHRLRSRRRLLEAAPLTAGATLTQSGESESRSMCRTEHNIKAHESSDWTLFVAFYRLIWANMKILQWVCVSWVGVGLVGFQAFYTHVIVMQIKFNWSWYKVSFSLVRSMFRSWQLRFLIITEIKNQSAGLNIKRI